MAGLAQRRQTKSLDETLRSQMPVLDGIRGLAILVVVAHRFDVLPDPVSLPARALSAFLESGWIGVQLFFVLSGFLITGILLDTRGQRGYYRSFLMRRVLRIFPIYYLVLFGAFVAAPLVLGHPIAGHQHQLWLWLYISNLVEPFGMAVAAFPHFWSLAVEEQFYLVWPFVVGWTRTRTLVIVCAGVIAVAFVSRIVVRALGNDGEAAYFLTFCRFDALALGALAALGVRTPSVVEWLARHQKAIGWGTLALLVAGGAGTHRYQRIGLWSQIFGYSILAWASAVLIVLGVLQQVSGGWLARVLSFAPLRSLGKYSYAMYIFHALLHLELGGPWMAQHHPHPTLLQGVIYLMVMGFFSYSVAVASYHLIEKYFLRLKSRFSVR
jgi:peptidoglycan/LPS O-acetylase OafA/YrhL